MEMFAQFCFQDSFCPASDSTTVSSCLFVFSEGEVSEARVQDDHRVCD